MKDGILARSTLGSTSGGAVSPNGLTEGVSFDERTMLQNCTRPYGLSGEAGSIHPTAPPQLRIRSAAPPAGAPRRSCHWAEKRRGEWANSPRRKSRSLISGGQSVLRQGGQPRTAAEKQKAAAEQIPPQPIFCVKSNRTPYLQGSSTQPILSSYPDFAYLQPPHRLLRKKSQ